MSDTRNTSDEFNSPTTSVIKKKKPRSWCVVVNCFVSVVCTFRNSLNNSPQVLSNIKQLNLCLRIRAKSTMLFISYFCSTQTCWVCRIGVLLWILESDALRRQNKLRKIISFALADNIVQRFNCSEEMCQIFMLLLNLWYFWQKRATSLRQFLSLRSWQLPRENTQIADLLMETMSDWIPKIVAKQQEVDLFHTLPVRMSSLTLGMRYFLRLH